MDNARSIIPPSIDRGMQMEIAKFGPDFVSPTNKIEIDFPDGSLLRTITLVRKPDETNVTLVIEWI